MERQEPETNSSYQPASTVPEKIVETPAGPWKKAVRGEACDSQALFRDLETRIRGTVRFDKLARMVYSTDASIYQVEPLGVVIPKDEEDVSALVEICARHRASITARGAGTSLAGQTCGHGVIADLSQNFDQILEVDRHGMRVRLQPGVVLDHLNAHLSPEDLFFGPDVATSSRATLGGMTNNNSSGARSIIYGMTIDHVERVREILSDGTILDWGPMTWDELERRRAKGNREADLLDGLCRILETHREEIKKRFPKVLRRVGGYPLDRLLEQYEAAQEDPTATFNPALVFVGSEGTLGILVELVLRLVPLKHHRRVVLLEFNRMREALKVLPPLVETGPSAVELLDHNILNQALQSPGLKEEIGVFQGSPNTILIVEYLGEDEGSLHREVAAKFETIRNLEGPVNCSLLASASEQEKIWKIRKAGLGIMMRMRGKAKPCAFIEDAAVPIDRVGDYVDELYACLAEEGLKAGAYAHASVGLLHIRPILDLYSADGVRQLRKIADKSVELSLKYGGSFSGEHGDGFARSEFLPATHGLSLCNAFKQVKQLFDPLGILNPGKIVDPYPMDRNLRFGEGYSPPPVETVFDYSEWGSFSDAVDMCSGVGQCRNRGVAVMCPSYMATKNEFHTTRARANALRDALSGRIGSSRTAGENDLITGEVLEALDLCLACKACKTECPTGVDMARWKAEILHQVHRKKGASLSSRFIASYPLQARLGSSFAPLSNWVLQSRPARRVMESLFGLDRRIPPPLFHRTTFRKWFRRYENTPEYHRLLEQYPDRCVVLFVDASMNHNQPHVGMAAVRLLASLGYPVRVLDHEDDGRTLISKGFLDRARELAQKNLEALEPALEKGWPVLGCEPSSILTFRDETPDLVPGEASRRLAEQSWTVAEFVDREIVSGNADLVFPENSPQQKILFHAHCFSKALADPQAAVRLMNRIPNTTASLIDAGCCGMAGSFGHETDHYEVSLRVGEERLFPAVREAGEGTMISCEGFSCRHQIAHHVPGTQPRHYVEILAEAVAAPST